MSIADKLITIADNTPLVAAAVEAKKPGKNLLNFPYTIGQGVTYVGITATVEADGSVKLNGTYSSTGGAVTDFALDEKMTLPVGTYTVSGCPAGGAVYTYRCFVHGLRANGDPFYANDCGAGSTFVINDGDTVYRISIRVGKDLGTVKDLTFYPQLEKGSEATSYEPYKDPAIYAQALEKAGQLKTAMENLKEELCDV